jgi:hypothetical protein
LKPAQANSSQDLISKITRAKCTVGMAQVVECLFCKCKALSSNPSPTKKKKSFEYKQVVRSKNLRTACLNYSFQKWAV